MTRPRTNTETEPDHVEWIPIEDDHQYSEFHRQYWDNHHPSSPFPTEPLYVGLQNLDGSWMSPNEVFQAETFRIANVLDNAVEGRLLIRDEYKLFYSWLERDSGGLRQKGAVVSGQPGIGKSAFLYYCLARRLWDRKEALLVLEDNIYLFTGQGVYRLKSGVNEVRHVMPRTWVLIDSDNTERGPPSSLLLPFQVLYRIHAASPNPKRFKNWKKNFVASLLHMNPWTWEEIWAGFRVQIDFKDALNTPDFMKMSHHLFTVYGPSARTVYMLVAAPSLQDSFEGQLQKAIRSLNGQLLNTMLNSDEIYTSHPDISHQLLLLTRAHTNQLNGSVIRTLISERIKEMVIDRFYDAMDREIALVYHIFNSHPELAPSAGRLFDAFCHKKLSAASARYLMVPTKSQLKGTYYHFTANPVSPYAQSTLLPFPFYDHAREKIRFNPGANLGVLDPFKYYIPARSNSPAYDSFVVGWDGILHAFQITKAKEQEAVDEGLADLWQKSNNRPFRFIVVVPEGQGVTLKLKPEWVKKVEVFMIYVDIEHIPVT